MQTVSVELSICTEVNFASAVVLSRKIKGISSFLRYLKSASFFVQIAMGDAPFSATIRSFSVKKRIKELGREELSSISMPTSSFLDVEIATDAYSFEWEMEMSASSVAKNGLPLSV